MEGPTAAFQGETWPYAIGVRIRRDKLTGVVVNLDGAIVPFRAGAEPGVLTRSIEDTAPATIVGGVAALAEELLSVQTEFRERVIGLGAAVGGHIHGDIGEVHLSPDLDWRSTVPLGRLLMEATGLRAVTVDDDANSLAVAEQLFGQGGQHGSFAVAKVRAGVSSGLVLDHELYTGATGLAGELGHFVVEPGGAECYCGNRGCLQTTASRDAMLRAARAAGQEIADIDDLAALARAGDHTAQEVVSQAGEALGRGLSMLLNLLNLSFVILYAEEGLVGTDFYLRSVRDSLRRHSFSSAADDCEIIVKVISEALEARGAASMAFRDLADELT
jgi:predicted NBD/HSP70 family sugar kinase